MKIILIAIALLAASCAQAEYREVILSSKVPLEIRDSEIRKEEAFGTRAGKVILGIELVGEKGIPIHVTADPYIAVGSYVQAIRSYCSEKTLAPSGLQEIPVSDRMLRNFLGTAVDGGEAFSIVVDGSMCMREQIDEDALFSSPTFTCGTLKSGRVCALEIREPSYFAHVLLQPEEISRWREIASGLSRYLRSVVRLKEGSS